MSVQTLTPDRTTGRSAAFQQCLNPACSATYGVDEALFTCA